jgi:DNA-binding transcriptional regulator YdaS (Cro superfamily)
VDRKTNLKKAFEGIDRKRLADALNIRRRNYIDQVVGGHVIVSAKRAKEIERATLGRISAKLLRPDIFDA